MSTDLMKTLYKRLAEVGVDSNFLANKVLPDWWDDAIAQNPSGYAQAITLLSRNLGIELESLQRNSSQIIWKELGRAKFKRSEKVTDAQLLWASRLSIRAAQLACIATDSPTVQVPTSAKEIRELILKTGASAVTLNALLDYCWETGIPVLHISKFPKKTRKMDGLSVRIQGRPVIIISREMKYSAWLLFILAHELGHIARHHLDNFDFLVDEKVAKESPDEEERVATDFAVELLTGHPELRYTATYRIDAEALAQAAYDKYQRYQVDPGVVALNYAWSQKFMPIGMAALRLIEPNAHAVDTIREKMLSRLNWELLPEESGEFLRRVTDTDQD